ncbi:low molecular weight protein arginine phosphatase [Ureibacillus sp. 179-F W5.1 NHS]|uniref:Low molecular weight protein arginine phosphatase n=1 Tax=Lysinibacillus halotolerans TaxID=1368476 RepID=A0A3M8HC64_9BACI|nr:low molecular weight protein arginine phosphatase [Lysinibacillus halotolerans]RNC99919.1 low molecular weight protein arginine phosphatase [Lysinibacillus halotolerans]
MNIYFICTGNTCRSPMAEAILKSKNVDGVQVKSAGIYALEGGGISENAKAVLQHDQIDFEHMTSQVKPQDIEWADLILTMTGAHKNMILHTFPNAQNKTFTLKEYVKPYGSKDVSDPFGGDIGTYRQTYLELNQLIDELIIKISENEMA